jgi:hypothetical protein
MDEEMGAKQCIHFIAFVSVILMIAIILWGLIGG